MLHVLLELFKVNRIDLNIKSLHFLTVEYETNINVIPNGYIWQEERPHMNDEMFCVCFIFFALRIRSLYLFILLEIKACCIQNPYLDQIRIRKSGV